MGTTTGCNNTSSGENQLQNQPSSLTALPHVNSSLPAHGAATSSGGVGGGMVCEEQYCLRWHDFQTNVTSAFSSIRDEEDLLDVTLVCPDGGMLRAHKLMLSACSPMFKAMLQRTPAHPQPVIFMHGVKRHSDVAAILNFMYRGEVNVGEGDIGSFLAIAEDLKVRGLTQEDLKDRLPPGLTATSPSSNKRKHDCSGSEGDDGEEEDMDPEPVRVKPEPGNSAETGSSVMNARKQHVVICKSATESSDSQINKKLFQQQQSHLHPCGNRGSGVKSEKVRRVSSGCATSSNADCDDHGTGSYRSPPTEGEVSYHRLGGRDADDPMSTMMVALSHKGWHCPECLHTSTTKGNLKSHILSGRHKLFEKSHPCNYCPRSYSTRQSLQVHVSTHHRYERDSEYHNQNSQNNPSSSQGKPTVSSQPQASQSGSQQLRGETNSTNKDAASTSNTVQTLQSAAAATTIAPQQVVSQIVQTYQQQQGGGVKTVSAVPSEVSAQNPFVSYLNQQASVMAVSNAMAVTGAAQVPGLSYQAIQGGTATNNDMRLQ